MTGMFLLGGLTLVLVLLGVIEFALHRRNLARVPIRIHVNGTRGKSTVTRLIAAGLRAGGIRTCCKTTGTLARMSFSDRSEYPVFRPGKANVIEQLRIVKAAAADEAEALVVECMALMPELQSLCELRFVQATHGVITNARADHLDVMGPSSRDVALALAASCPVGGKLFTAEQIHRQVFEDVADDRGSRFFGVDEEVHTVSEEELAGFAYIEHAENVALALKVCEDLGVDRERALRGMWQVTPDPGAMMVHRYVDPLSEITFVNAFAANDPDSTEFNWHLALTRFPHVQKRIAVFSCRSDRTDRSRQLAEACPAWEMADHYLVVGSETRVFARRALESGMNPMRLNCMEGAEIDDIIEEIKLLAGPSALVVGMGNIDGPGWKLASYFAAHSVDEDLSSTILEAA